MYSQQSIKVLNKFDITIHADESHITKVEFSKCDQNPNSVTEMAISQLKEYLEGDRETFDLPIKPEGTEFQKKVWSELDKIPFGKYLNYKEVAEQVGGANYARAVGSACNKNPIPIFIPCHRVLGSNMHLVGYAGGTDLKEKLLQLERVIF